MKAVQYSAYGTYKSRVRMIKVVLYSVYIVLTNKEVRRRRIGCSIVCIVYLQIIE